MYTHRACRVPLLHANVFPVRESTLGEHERGRERRTTRWRRAAANNDLSPFAELQDQGRLEDCRDDCITSGEDKCPGSIRVLLFTREEEEM